jgi:hypothetical protein
MTLTPTLDNWIATLCFGAAILHSLSVSWFARLSHRFQHRTFASTVFHFLAEIEVVFGVWAGLYVVTRMVRDGMTPALDWVDSKTFDEAAFVSIIMAMSATKPIISLASRAISVLSRVIPIPRIQAIYLVTLIVGPLLGSLITEPAAMTVCALLLKKEIFNRTRNAKLVYSSLATLFVNVSIGGTLTSFAAPPVLMVAKTWDWDSLYMIEHFGWKSALAVLINALLALMINLNTFKKVDTASLSTSEEPSDDDQRLWVQVISVGFILMSIIGLHHPAFLVGHFLIFVGFKKAAGYSQSDLKAREALLVGFFLSGLIILTGEQTWWLRPLLTSLQETTLYVGATLLTAITDNAALTALAAQVPDLSEASKHAVVAGAVAGGGLTLVANAPNPAGYSLLRSEFGANGINPLTLLKWAIPPTLIAFAAFLL